MNRLIKIRLKTLILVSLAAYSGLIVFLLATNPFDISPAALLVPFILFFVATFALVSCLSRLFNSLFSFNQSGLSNFRLSLLISGFPTLFFLIQSISQVNAYDLALLVVLFAMVDFYISRFNKSGQPGA